MGLRDYQSPEATEPVVTNSESPKAVMAVHEILVRLTPSEQNRVLGAVRILLGLNDKKEQ